MGAIKDQFEADEGKRQAAIKAYMEGDPYLEQVTKGPPPIPSINELIFAASLLVFPEVTIGGSIGEYATKLASDKFLSNYPTIRSIVNLAGSIVGSIAGGVASSAALGENLISQLTLEDEESIKEILKTLIKSKSLQTPGPNAPVEELTSWQDVLFKKIREILVSPERKAALREEVKQSGQVATEQLPTATVPEQFEMFDKSSLSQEEIRQRIQKTVEDMYSRLGKIFNATGKKEIDAKVVQYSRLKQLGLDTYTALLNAQLMSPRITLQKLLTDSVNMPVQAAFKSVGVAVVHGPEAGVRNMLGALYALRESFSDGLSYAAQSFGSNEPEFQKAMGLGIEGSYNVEDYKGTYPEAALRWLGAGMSVGRRSVMAADQFAKAMGYRMEAQMNSFIEALEEADRQGLVGGAKNYFAENYAKHLVDNMSEALVEKTKQGMHYLTFTNSTKFSNALATLAGSNIALRLALPYTRVPINLAAEGIRLSPLAPLLPEFYQDVAEGGIQQASTLAKWAFGTALWGWIADKQAKGEVTGPGPRGQIAQFWPFRKVPNSIKIGDNYYGVQHIGPYGQTITTAAAFAENYHLSKDPLTQASIVNVATKTLSELADNVDFVDLMSNIIHAKDVVERGAGNQRVAQEFIGRLASGFIPAPVRIAENVIDPKERQAQNAWQIMEQNIPILAENVPLKYDMWGDPVYPPPATSDGELLSAPMRLLNELSPVPVYTSPKIDPVDAELYRLGVTPKPIPDHYTKVGGTVVPLTPEQQAQWAVQAGKGIDPSMGTQKDAMMDIISDPNYNDLSDFDKKNELQKIHDTWYHIARINVGDNEDIQNKVAQATEQKHDIGIPQPITLPGVGQSTDPYRDYINMQLKQQTEAGVQTPQVTAPPVTATPIPGAKP